MTVKEFKAGAELGEAIYIADPYVILSREEIVLASGTKRSLLEGSLLSTTDYYDHCEIKVREHDIYLADNTKKLIRKYAVDLWPNDDCIIRGEYAVIIRVRGAMVDYKLQDGSLGSVNPKSVTVKGERS